MNQHLLTPGARLRCATFVLLMLSLTVMALIASTNAPAPGWLTQPLSLPEAIAIALEQNGDVLQSLTAIKAAHGIAIQTRAIVLPKVRGEATFQHIEGVEDDRHRGGAGDRWGKPEDVWRGSVLVVQSLYEGGRMRSAWRASRLIREQAVLAHQAIVADTVLAVRTAYYDVLLAAQQIAVQQGSVQLLEQELANTRQRLEVGAVPRFDVLRGEVEVANARPRLIRARNAHRVAKNQLATLLGYNLPTNIWEDIPLTLTTKLATEPLNLDLPSALSLARERRAELAALRAEMALRQERVVAAKAGYKPALRAFGGYLARNSEYDSDFYRDVSGPTAGVALTWDIFDGRLTQGRVMEERAREQGAEVALTEATRRVEQEVRTAYSSFIEAREVLESQQKVVEQAEEAIRLAISRYEAGSGTQLDVLTAQTALTQARSTHVEALRDYLVARARLERAIGVVVQREVKGEEGRRTP